MVAGGALLTIMGIACGNMAFRALWFPIKGSYELIGFLGALVASLALGYTQKERGHTLVDILSSRYPERARNTVEGVSDLVTGLFFAAICYELLRWTGDLMGQGEVSETLRIPFYPFVIGVATGGGLLALVSLSDAFKALLRK